MRLLYVHVLLSMLRVLFGGGDLLHDVSDSGVLPTSVIGGPLPHRTDAWAGS